MAEPAEIQIPLADPAFATLQAPVESSKTSPPALGGINPLSRGMIKLYLLWTIPFQATFAVGYAIAVLTAINSMQQYQDYFQFTGLGISTGLVFCLAPVAACSTFWLGPILSDQYGRRGGIIINTTLVVIGTLLCGLAQNVGMLLAGRLIFGAGVGMIQTGIGKAAPPYVVETAPSMNRGLLTVVGSGLGTAMAIATESISSPWAWRIPMLLQLVPSLYLLLGALLILPESPRWFISKCKLDPARAFLVKYHGDGILTPAVEEEFTQICASVEKQVAAVTGGSGGGKGEKGKRKGGASGMWNYRGLVKSRPDRYRLMLAVMMGAFGQLSGNTLSYFLPSLYAQVGVTSTRSQLIMTLVATCASFPAAVLGTYHLDILGRRKVLVLGTLGCMVMLACAMGCSAASGANVSTTAKADQYFSTSTSNGTISTLVETMSERGYGILASEDVVSGTGNAAASKGAIAFLIFLGVTYAWGYMPLLPVYPGEVLATDQRATGMGCVVLAANLANVVQQFALPIALQKIGFWTYLPYIIWTLVETIAWYLFAVETRGRSLEELDEVFNAPNPVRASLAPPPPNSVVSSETSARSSFIGEAEAEAGLALGLGCPVLLERSGIQGQTGEESQISTTPSGGSHEAGLAFETKVEIDTKEAKKVV